MELLLIKEGVVCWLKDIACLGKTSFDQCTHGGWGNTAGCDHSRDAGVICGDLSAGTTT